MTRSLTVLMFLLFVSTAVDAGPRKKATRFFDVGAIVREYAESATVDLGTLGGPIDGYWCGEEDGSFLTGTDLVARLEAAGLFGNGHELWYDAEQLRVTADAEDLPKVAAYLNDLLREAMRRVEVDMRLLDVPVKAGSKILADPEFESLATGTLDAESADRLVDRIRAAGGTVREANTVSRPARRASAGRVTVRSYVRDMAVEIAGATAVGDPQVDWMREGWSVDVRPHILAGDGVFLEVLLQTAALDGPVRRVNLEADDLGSVELPAWSRRVLFSAGRVAKGKVMALLLASREQVRILLLRPRVTGRSVYRFLPTSAFTANPVGYAMIWGDEDGADATVRVGASELIPALWPPRPVLRSLRRRSSLLEDLMSDVGAKLGREPAEWSATGHGVLLPDVPMWFDGAREFLTVREDRDLRSLPVRVRVLEGGRAVAVARVLAVPGREVCVSDGMIRSYVGDWDVEVAHDAARIGDPQIYRAWGGMALTFRFDAGPDEGEYAAQVSGEIATLEPEFETKRTGNTVTGIIEAPRGRTVAVQAETVVTAGKPCRIRPTGDLTIEITLRK